MDLAWYVVTLNHLAHCHSLVLIPLMCSDANNYSVARVGVGVRAAG